MSISLDLLPAVTNIGDTDIMHLRSAAGNDFKITGANVLRNLNHDLAANSLNIGQLTGSSDIHLKQSADTHVGGIKIERTGANLQTYTIHQDSSNRLNIGYATSPGAAPTITHITLDSGGGVLIHTITSLHPTLDTIESIGDWAIIGRNNSVNLVAKVTRIAVSHYTNAEEPMLIAVATAGATDNLLSIGGGAANANTATTLRFFTAATTTTLLGTERGRIPSTGQLLWGQTTVDTTSAIVQIAGNLSLRGASNQDRTLYFASDATIFWDESEDYFLPNKEWVVTIEGATEQHRTKVIEIGDWDMDATTTITKAHGLPDHEKIRLIKVMIRDDATNNILPLTSTSPSTGHVAGAVGFADATNVNISRTIGDKFDSSFYNATSFNRGWIIIKYAL